MEVKALFNKDSTRYDNIINTTSLNYSQVIDLILRIISLNKKMKIRILDLGCGTVNIATLILKKFKNSEYHGVDFSNGLLEVADKKLKKYGKRYELIKSDFRIFTTKKKFDVIISNAAIHHLSDKDKFKLFKNIYGWLKRSGQFIYADSIKSENVLVERQFQRIKNYIRLSKAEDKEYIKSLIIKSKKVDNPATYEDIIKWLKRIGYKNIDIYYKYLTKIIIVAKK